MENIFELMTPLPNWRMVNFFWFDIDAIDVAAAAWVRRCCDLEMSAWPNSRDKDNSTLSCCRFENFISTHRNETSSVWSSYKIRALSVIVQLGYSRHFLWPSMPAQVIRVIWGRYGFIRSHPGISIKIMPSNWSEIQFELHVSSGPWMRLAI